MSDASFKSKLADRFFSTFGLGLSLLSSRPGRNAKFRGQAAIEYILLVSFGLFIVIVGFTLAFYVKNFTDSALKLVSANRDVLLGFLLK